MLYASGVTALAPDELSSRLVEIICSNPSQLSSFLSDNPTHLVDHDAVREAMISHLPSSCCSTVWQLHSHHIVRLESVMQLCPPHSSAAASLVAVLLDDDREGWDKLNVAFCQSPFSNLILALLRLSTQPPSALPLYPLAPSSASSLLSALFFSSHPQSPTVRQHIAVLLLLVRPPPLRQQLLSSLLLQCLSSPSSSSASVVSSLSPMDLSSVLTFFCQRMSATTLLSSYISALTNAAPSTSSTSFSLTSHRTFLNLFISPRHFSADIGRLLFDSFATTLSSAIVQRDSALFTLVLQLARHCITNLHANGAAAAVMGAVGKRPWQLPRDYSAWFDERLSWVTGKDEEAGRKGSPAGGGKGGGAKRKRKEKYVLRKKGNESAQHELDDDDDDMEEEEEEEEDSANAGEGRADGRSSDPTAAQNGAGQATQAETAAGGRELPGRAATQSPSAGSSD